MSQMEDSGMSWSHVPVEEPVSKAIKLFFVWIAILSMHQQVFARENHWAEFTVLRLDGRYLSEIRPGRVMTPHLKFARPLAGGPVKVLFIVPQNTARDVVELWQRMDIDFAAVTVYAGDDLAVVFPLHTAVEGQSVPETERSLDRYLDGNYDVICLAGVKFDMLPAKARFKILRAVKNGTGLFGVLKNARTCEPIFQKLKVPVSAPEVLQGSSLVGLPFFSISEKNTASQEMNKLMAPTPAGFGKGRIAWLNYHGPHDVNYHYAGDCFGRPASPGMGKVSRPEACDAAMAISAKAMLWAAGRKPAFNVVPEMTDGAVIKSSEWPKQFIAKLIRNDSGSSLVTLEAHLVRPDGKFQEKTSVKVEAKDRETQAAFMLPPAPEGPAFLWCIIKNDKGEVFDWSVSAVNIEGTVSFKDFKLEPEAVGCNGETVVTGQIDGKIPTGAKIVAEARDSCGRLFWHQEEKAEKSVNLKLPMTGACGRSGELTLRLVSGSDILAMENLEFFINRPLGYEFLNLIWGHPGIGVSDWQVRGIINDLHGRQIEKAGFNAGMVFHYGHTLEMMLGNLVNSARAMARSNARWMFYCAHIHMNGHLRKFLNPAERKQEEGRLTALATCASAYGPCLYNLGDENGIYGQFPEDLNRFELTAYRDFLKRSYDGNIKSLNKAWGSKYSKFSEVEVNPEGNAEVPVPRKYDIKAFWEWVYADTGHWMRDAILKGDPHAQVGAEGSSGEDLELTISKLDWWAPYKWLHPNTAVRFWKPWNAFRGNWWGGVCGRGISAHR